MQYLNNLLDYLVSLAAVLPLEMFALLAAFIEEVIAPIPSPVVMVLTGTIAHAQNQALWHLALLALLGAFGKTVGAWLLYVIADRLEDVVVDRFGKFLGVTNADIENIGKRLNRSWKDDVLLFVARALPIIPSAPVSIACGIIKINKRTFIGATFTGTFFRNLMYLYVGYAGVGNYKELSQGFDSMESFGQLFLFAVIVAVIAWAYVKRKKINQS